MGRRKAQNATKPAQGERGKTPKKVGKNEKTEDPPIVVGLDFGTTYSGVAWARSGQPDVINLVTNWRSAFNYNSDKEKVPSQICFDASGQPSSWGYETTAADNHLKWFKLLILDEADVPTHLRLSHEFVAVKDHVQRLGKDPIENIQRALGRELVELSKFKVVVTLPAIWPVYAQPRMREAVEFSGMLDDRSPGETILSFIPEPEAAALATMDDMARRPDIKNNDHFVVCDAGGGTVDLITYQITQQRPMTVRESVKGDGKLCGAIILDRGFRRILHKRLPHSILLQLDTKGMARIMNDEWENGIKTRFCGDDRPFKIPLQFPGTIEDRFHPPILSLQKKDLLSFYEPAAADVAGLVVQQIHQVQALHKTSPKFVILVGGYGKNQYLYSHLQKGLGDNEVLQASGSRPWTAVSRGAVIKGLTQENLSEKLRVVVDSRVARNSYETLWNVLPFDSGLHDPRDKVWDLSEQEYRAEDQTPWAHPSPDDPIGYHFYQDLERADQEIEVELVYSEAHIPPRRCDSSVKRLCIIRWSNVPDFKSLQSYTRGGRKFRRVNYDLQMNAEGHSLDFAVYYKNRGMASQNVSVDFTDSGRLKSDVEAAVQS